MRSGEDNGAAMSKRTTRCLMAVGVAAGLVALGAGLDCTQTTTVPAPVPPRGLGSDSSAMSSSAPPDSAPHDTPAPSADPALVPPIAAHPSCADPCVGVPPPGFVGAVEERAGHARRCYDSALVKRPALAGSVAITLRLAPSGAICRVSAESSMPTDESDDFLACLKGVFNDGPLPAPIGGCLDVRVPLVFKRGLVDGGIQ